MLYFIVGVFWFSMGVALDLSLKELDNENDKKLLLATFLYIFYIYVWLF